MAVIIGGPVAGVTSWAGRTGAVVPTKADVGLGNASNTADADKPLSSAATTALAAKADLIDSALRSGQYHYAGSPSTTTTAAVANGSLRLAPFMLRRSTAITSLAAEVTTIGDTGSKVRLCIYADNGSAYPGNLLVDAGQIAGDVVAVAELAVSLTLPAGLLWFGAVAQSVSTTAPTLRYCAASWTPPIPLAGGTTLPGANATVQGWAISGQTAALPSTAPTGAGGAGGVPRLLFKVA